MARHATADEYFASLDPPLRDIAAAARAAIASGLSEAYCAMRWAKPTWNIGKAPICYMKAASEHLTLGLWRGASIHDDTGRLEISERVMAHLKLRSVCDVDAAVFADWLGQARTICQNRAGESQPFFASGCQAEAAA
jgi:hypothetical protein